MLARAGLNASVRDGVIFIGRIVRTFPRQRKLSYSGLILIRPQFFGKIPLRQSIVPWLEDRNRHLCQKMQPDVAKSAIPNPDLKVVILQLESAKMCHDVMIDQ